ncbi:MAG: hypothetical protein LBU47_01500 [Christensenellaceae bacterium]|jgi:phenylpyruvate tautomerase PptA (4-oxalocrotonate tautomerase family)|nr:hypothetical protein [Christensenellaceae bacterium]
MPYLKLSVNRDLSPDEKHALCEEIGRLMPLLPGKTRENTMMDIVSGSYIEMGDASPALNLEVRLFHAAPKENKQNFVREISALLEKKTGVKPARMYMNLIEYESWASGGEYRE